MHRWKIVALLHRWAHGMWGIYRGLVHHEWHCDVDLYGPGGRRTVIGCVCGKVFWSEIDYEQDGAK